MPIRARISERPNADELAAATLAHYQSHAVDYREGTASHDVKQKIDALLCAIDGEVSQQQVALDNAGALQLLDAVVLEYCRLVSSFQRWRLR